MRCSLTLSIVAVTILATTAQAQEGVSLGTGFTYQGRLESGGLPFSGDVSMTFRLFNLPVVGVQAGSDITINPVTVTNGLFAVDLDFGPGIFTGAARFLEVEVDGNPLSPRQFISLAPYSVYSLNTRGITVDSSEDVAIGTASTTYKFQVYTDDRSRAVYGNHFSTAAGTNYGVYGRSNGPDGYGVFGLHDSSAGTTAGVYGETDSTEAGAVAVHGVVDSTSPGSLSAAVRGENQGTGLSGIGVFGSHDGQGWGVHGKVVGGLGRAVFGEVTGVGGVGGYFENTGGIALYADGVDNTGSIAAVQILSGAQTMYLDGNEIDSDASVGLHLQHNSPEDLFMVEGGGSVGIGTTDLGSFDRVRIEAPGVNIPLALKKSGLGSILTFYHFNTLAGSISLADAGNTVVYGTFTGAHWGWTDETIEPLALVRMTGENRYLNRRYEGEIIYGIETTMRANDSACLGSYLQRQQDSAGDDVFSPHLIAAVGNGDLWVTQGSDPSAIEPGDLLISSDVPGCAMLDDEARFATGNVIARATDHVDWSQVEPDAAGIRRTRISVMFESFVRGPLNDDEEAIASLRTENESLARQLKQQAATIAELLRRVDELEQGTQE